MGAPTADDVKAQVKSSDSAHVHPMSSDVVLALVAQSLISVGTHLCAKRATEDLDPLLLVVTRTVISGALFAILLAFGSKPALPPRKSLPWLLLFSFLAGPVNQAFFMMGLAHSKATHAALLYALTPLGVYLVTLARGRERFSGVRFIGIVLAFCGVTVLLVGRGLEVSAEAVKGDLLILVAVVAWILWTAESRAFSEVHGGFRTAAWSIIFGGLWMLPLAPFVYDERALTGLTPTVWACIGYLCIFTSIISYILWNYGLARTDASRVAVFANIQPIVTTFAAWYFLGEVLTVETFVGGAMVLIGVRLAQRTR